MLKKLFFVFFVLSIVSGYCPLSGANANDRLLDSLDHVLQLRDYYEKQRIERIETYKSLLENVKDPEQRYSLHEKIATQYKAFICDSILHYLGFNLDLAQSMNNSVLQNRTKLLLIETYTLSGMYVEAADMLKTINLVYVRDSLEKQTYYNVAYDLYWKLQFESQESHAKEHYRKQADLYRDSLYRVIDRSSDLFLSMEERNMRRLNQLDEALKINRQRLGQVTPYSPEYAIVKFYESLIWRALGDTDKQFECLVHSAITDILCATKDNTSLHLVANWLFGEGDINRSNAYIQYCMEDARFYNARLRGVQLSTTLPLIIGSYNAKIDGQINRLRFMLVTISILLLSLVSMFLLVLSQKRKLIVSQKKLQLSHDHLDGLRTELLRINEEQNTVNAQLVETNYIKESYIAQFFGLTASYMNRLEGLRRMVNKKLREGKKDEVLELTRPTATEDDDLQEFYTYFDSSFLGIYPTFIEEYNKLLDEEKRVVPEIKKGKPVLTTELRVFALIRLGFQDSASIAGMLRFSVNTIYNVRAQAKNKSRVPRQQFEEEIRKIGTFSPPVV